MVDATDEGAKLQLLGSTTLVVGGAPLALPSRRTMALLAYVATQAQPVRRDHLSEVLWDDPTHARKNLRVLLSNLRRALPDHVVIDRERVAVRNGDLDVDVLEFERAAAADRMQPSGGLRDAARRYTGSFLDGLELREAAEFTLWRERERARLRSLAVSIHEDIALAALDAGDLDAAVDFSRRMLEIDAADENAVRLLMEALARTGRRREALEVFEACRNLVEHELGLAVFPETIEVADAVRDGRFGATRARLTPPLRDPDPDTNVSVDNPDLVGRSALVHASRRRIGSGILTFTGRGGVGKTVLALEVVRASGRTPVLVDLVPVTDVDRVATVALAALGHEASTPDAWRALAEVLTVRSSVLVLDRAEHLGAELGRPLAELVRSAPDMGVVVTSRAALHAPGERVIPVPPLAVPSTDSIDHAEIRSTPAVELFLRRADAAGHEGIDAHLDAIAAICRRLDGLPLAIELAVPLLSVYSVGGLRTQLERSGGEGVGLLSLPSARGSRSLVDTITRSYELLPDDAQAVFRRLSVFAGAFEIAAATAAAAQPEAHVVRAITQLTQLNLVERDPSEDDLLRLPHTIRDTAQTLLAQAGERAAATQRHVEYFQAVVGVAGRELEGPHEVSWLHRLERRADDLRAALTRLIDQAQTDDALVMTTQLGPFWLHRGRAIEGCELLEQLVDAAPSSAHASLARQWIARLRVDVRGDEVEVARSAASALTTELDHMGDDPDPHVRLRAMSMLGHVLNLAGEDARAREVTALAIDEARDVSSWWLPELLHRSALFASLDGRVDVAIRDAHDAYEFARRMGNGHMEVQSLLSLIQLPGHEDLGLQLPDLKGALDLARTIGDRRSEGWIVASLGATAVFAGDVEGAAGWFLEGVRSSLRSGSRQSTWFNVMGTAAIASLDGERLFAARVHGSVTPRLPQLRREMPVEYLDIYESLMDGIGRDDAAAAAIVAGGGLSPQSVLSEAEQYLSRRAPGDRSPISVA